MARDYKHQKRADTSAPRSGMGFVAGLVVGLTVALGVFIYDRRVPPMTSSAAREPVQRQSAPRPAAPAAKTPPAKAVPAASADPQFDFYEMLPKFEVVVPEQDESAPAQSRAAPLQKAGVYMLQAGSFRSSEDAERVRALIALQGVQSKIQRVSIDRDTWHRVRVGPIMDLKRLEETRSRLRQAQIETLVIRVGG